MTETLTDEERAHLRLYDRRGEKALRIIDQLTEALAAAEERQERSEGRYLARAESAEARVRQLQEALEAERAENADHLKVNRELASNLSAAASSLSSDEVNRVLSRAEAAEARVRELTERVSQALTGLRPGSPVREALEAALRAP